MINLKLLFSSSNKKETFELGRKCGYEEGIKDGMNLKCQQSESVSKQEFDELCNYLANKGLEITYSVTHEPSYTCGIMVRKVMR